jgi:hypothetical protein
MTSEVDEKEFQHAVCLYLKKKLGDSHEKEIASISSALGVNLSSPCNFNVETLFKASTDAVDEGMSDSP